LHLPGVVAGSLAIPPIFLRCAGAYLQLFDLLLQGGDGIGVGRGLLVQSGDFLLLLANALLEATLDRFQLGQGVLSELEVRLDLALGLVEVCARPLLLFEVFRNLRMCSKDARLVFQERRLRTLFDTV